MQTNPFEIAANIMFQNPHFSEPFTIVGKGTFPAIRGSETQEQINAKYGIYEDISTLATVQMIHFTVIGTPKKGDICYFNNTPNKHYRVQKTIPDAATQTIDLILGEAL